MAAAAVAGGVAFAVFISGKGQDELMARIGLPGGLLAALFIGAVMTWGIMFEEKIEPATRWSRPVKTEAEKLIERNKRQ
jgi:hypothetical protein